MNTPGLWCEAIALDYDFARRVGTLRMVQGHCCDMAGCIALFQRIDPAVQHIDTFSGDKRDTTYQRQGDGEWIAGELQ